MHLNKAHISDTFIQYIEMGIVSDLRCATSYLFSLLRSSDTIKSQSLGAQGIRFGFFSDFSSCLPVKSAGSGYSVPFGCSWGSHASLSSFAGHRETVVLVAVLSLAQSFGRGHAGALLQKAAQQSAGLLHSISVSSLTEKTGLFW